MHEHDLTCAHELQVQQSALVAQVFIILGDRFEYLSLLLREVDSYPFGVEHSHYLNGSARVIF